jgi:hypothetical protein
VIVSYKCACGEPLRYFHGRYVPLTGSASPIAGHVPAVAVADGKETVVLPEAVCKAGTPAAYPAKKPAGKPRGLGLGLRLSPVATDEENGDVVIEMTALGRRVGRVRTTRRAAGEGGGR